MSLLVVFDSKTMHRAKSGRITCVFYLSLDGVAFPDDNWNDFGDLLVAQLQQIADGLAIAGPGHSIKFEFFDGPFVVEFFKASNHRIAVQGTHRPGVYPSVRGSTTVSELQHECAALSDAWQSALRDLPL
jgi:hypothetical protein